MAQPDLEFLVGQLYAEALSYTPNRERVVDVMNEIIPLLESASSAKRLAAEALSSLRSFDAPLAEHIINRQSA